MKLVITTLTLLVVSIIGYYIYYYYYDTLTFLEITGKSSNSNVNFIIDIFDFDTGITRSELNEFKSKLPHYREEISNINSISDENQFNMKNQQFIQEISQDSVIKKLWDKIFPFNQTNLNNFSEFIKNIE